MFWKLNFMWLSHSHRSGRRNTTNHLSFSSEIWWNQSQARWAPSICSRETSSPQWSQALPKPSQAQPSQTTADGSASCWVLQQGRVVPGRVLHAGETSEPRPAAEDGTTQGTKGTWPEGPDSTVPMRSLPRALYITLVANTWYTVIHGVPKRTKHP